MLDVRHCLAAALLVVASRSARPQGPINAGAIDSFVRSTMQARSVPGAAVAVIDGGVTIYQKTFGLSNVETRTPVTDSSVFELASLTKEFTAAAVMLLVQDGKLHLDSAITSYLKDAPPAWAGITVRQLLTHTSGILAGGIVFSDGSPLMKINTAQAFASIASAHTLPAGEVGFYSDGGYFLLGMVIEHASGLTYRDFMQRRIFMPLGMAHTSLTDHRSVLAGRVATYELANGKIVNWRRDWDYELPSFFGVWSTLGDVVRWDNALRTGALLSKASLDEMWSPGTLEDHRDALVDGREYGFGFRIDQIRGHRLVWHNGASGTILLHFLDEPVSIVVLTNLANTAGRHPTILADGIAGLTRAAYTPIQLLPTSADPTPHTTEAVHALLDDMAASRTSDAMTPAHAAYFRALPPVARDGLAPTLRDLGALTFIACDDVAGRGVRITDPISRICYYCAMAGGRLTYFTVWFTANDKVAHIRFGAADDL